MPFIGGILSFIVLMAILSEVAPGVANVMGMMLSLGFMIVVAHVLFQIASAGSRALRKGAEVVDYLFVEHPAEPSVNAALRTRERLDTNALQEALTPSARVFALDKPLYHYKNQTKKARALKEKLDEDTSLAQAAVRRERARAEVEDRQRDRRVARRRKHRRAS